MGTGVPRGATPLSGSGAAAVRRYPEPKVRSNSFLGWSSHEEIVHVQAFDNM